MEYKTENQIATTKKELLTTAIPALEEFLELIKTAINLNCEDIV